MDGVLEVTQAAIESAVKLLNAIGTTGYYTYGGFGTVITVKCLIRELGSAELTGDFRQGDLKVELDAASLPGIPQKHDTLEIDGLTYTVLSPGGAPRRVGDIVYTYKFVVRGG